MTEDRRPACNTGLAQWRVTCYYDSLVVKETLVFQMNISANNPPLRQALNRFCAVSKILTYYSYLIFS